MGVRHFWSLKICFKIEISQNQVVMVIWTETMLFTKFDGISFGASYGDFSGKIRTQKDLSYQEMQKFEP